MTLTLAIWFGERNSLSTLEKFEKPWKKLVDAGRAVASRASDLGRVTVPRFRSAFRPQTPNPRQLPPFYLSVFRIFIISRALEGGSWSLKIFVSRYSRLLHSYPNPITKASAEPKQGCSIRISSAQCSPSEAGSVIRGDAISSREGAELQVPSITGRYPANHGLRILIGPNSARIRSSCPTIVASRAKKTFGNVCLRQRTHFKELFRSCQLTAKLKSSIGFPVKSPGFMFRRQWTSANYPWWGFEALSLTSETILFARLMSPRSSMEGSK